MLNPDVMIVSLDDTTAMSATYAASLTARKGEKFNIEVTFDDTEDYRAFGPYLLVDAVMYAQHAETEADPVAWLTAMDRKCNPANYPANDWTGLLG